MRKPKIAVVVNVYDLAPSNNFSYQFGVGVFHSGVELFGREYSFAGHNFDATGMFTCEPRCADGAIFREAIVVGEVEMTMQEVQSVVDSVAEDFPGNTYNLITRNCNHFSNALCYKLLGHGIPNWINRAAYVGSFFSCVLNPLLNKAQGTETLQIEDRRGPSFAAFSGSGRAVAEASTANTVTNITSEDDKRDRLAQAALRRFAAQQSPSEG